MAVAERRLRHLMLGVERWMLGVRYAAFFAFFISRMAAMMKSPAAVQMHVSATLNAGNGFAKRK